VDEMLPHADTCFFNLTLPPYSSEDVMFKRLVTVITFDSGLNGDDVDAL
jgi:hypothetical protein